MQAFKCKICGGSLNIAYGQKVVECEYCGVKQTISIFKEPNVQEIYDRANGYLANNEFDKAENLFAQLLFDDKQNADAYWNILMCRYGVNYIKDPASGKYIPTCNRTLYTPIFNDENYKKALEYADDEQKAIYEENVKTIDEIQKGIIAVSKHEKPFDIFISYKETDKNGNRTKDSIVATELYEKLTAEGYKVFFSRITLEDKAGTEYEPYIYAALYSSKVMLTICSSKENIEAVWVRNEWGRFLSLQQKNADKSIIPLYFDMDKSELPDEFSMIPSFNIKEEGFEAELIRGIKKQIPLPIMFAQKRKARKKTFAISALSFLAVAVVCGIIFLPGIIKENIYGNKYEEAMSLFENQKYTEAKAIFETITEFENSEYMITRCERQPEYDKAMQYYYDGEYAKAAWAFKAMGDYEDAAEQQKKSELSWRKSLATVMGSENDCIGENEFDSTHGKLISVAGGSLYEDGYFTNASSNVNTNIEMENVIKHTSTYEGPQIILKSDGTLECQYQESEPPLEKSGFEELEKWKNIINFEYADEMDTLVYGQLQYIPIIGVKADGSLSYTTITTNKEVLNHDEYYSELTDRYDNELKKHIGKFNNVKSIKIYLSYYNGIVIVAVTNDGKMQILSNGEFHEEVADNIVDVVSFKHLLTNEGKVIEFKFEYTATGENFDISDRKIILEDIVYGGDNYFVSRNGTVCYLSDEIKNLNKRTTVWEEWTARLK